MGEPNVKRLSNRMPAHGSTLVVVSIMLTAVLVAGAAMISVSSLDQEEASASTRMMMLRACAASAKEAYMSRVRYPATLPTSFSMQVKNPNTSEVLLDLAEGHDPSAAHSALVVGLTSDPQNVQFVDDKSLGFGKTSNYNPVLTNNLGPRGAGMGGGGRRVIARCRDKVGRTVEVDLLIRYGL